MSLNLVATGKNVPEDINVVIEIPMNSEPVKYEVDKHSGALFVDRILTTPMRYPCNYGYVPHTRCGDGAPPAALGLRPLPRLPGCPSHCRPPRIRATRAQAPCRRAAPRLPTPRDPGPCRRTWLSVHSRSVPARPAPQEQITSTRSTSSIAERASRRATFADLVDPVHRPPQRADVP